MNNILQHTYTFSTFRPEGVKTVKGWLDMVNAVGYSENKKLMGILNHIMTFEEFLNEVNQMPDIICSDIVEGDSYKEYITKEEMIQYLKNNYN